jgi:hypothetical protein
MSTLKPTLETAERLILTADFAIRDEQNDARSQSLSLISIAISLRCIAESLERPSYIQPLCRRCGLPSTAMIHSMHTDRVIGGHAFEVPEAGRQTGGSAER